MHCYIFKSTLALNPALLTWRLSSSFCKVRYRLSFAQHLTWWIRKNGPSVSKSPATANLFARIWLSAWFQTGKPCRDRSKAMHSSATVLECEAVKDTRTAPDFKHRPNTGMNREKSLIVYLNSKMDNANTVFVYFVNFFIEQICSKGNECLWLPEWGNSWFSSVLQSKWWDCISH
jgi:hypothetical protein